MASLADEKAVCTQVMKSSSQPTPVPNNRTERQVQRGKAAASEEGSRLANKAQSGDDMTKKELDAYLDAFDKIYNFGIPREETAKLGYFLGRRAVGQSATAAEIALAKEGIAARDMLMREFHKAALGSDKKFLKNVAMRVGEAVKATRSERDALNAAKEILRDEFAIMRTDALDAVLSDPKLTRQLEAVGFTVKKWEDVKHLKNAKYLPRLFFEAHLDGKTVRIGFDIDHSLVGFAESRTEFVEDFLKNGAKADEALLRSIFDPKNFTLETARHNRNYLEGVRAEGERFEAAIDAAKESRALNKGQSSASALKAAAAEGLKDLKELNEAAAKVKLMMARLSTMEESAAKRELMDTLAELSSILGDSI